MAGELHAMPNDPAPPARPLYRLTLNVSGEGFDIDVTVDGITMLSPALLRLVVAALDEAVLTTGAEIEGADGQHR